MEFIRISHDTYAIMLLQNDIEPHDSMISCKKQKQNVIPGTWDAIYYIFVWNDSSTQTLLDISWYSDEPHWNLIHLLFNMDFKENEIHSQILKYLNFILISKKTFINFILIRYLHLIVLHLGRQATCSGMELWHSSFLCYTFSLCYVVQFCNWVIRVNQDKTIL